MSLRRRSSIMLNAISAFFAEYGGILLTGTRDTLLMVVISTLFA